MVNKKITAIVFAILAAIFYSINMPFSKLLIHEVSETIMAGLLYIGAGIGIGCMFFFTFRKEREDNLLTKKDFPYVLGMIILDIAAPISLMYGLNHTTASNASLLNNFEIVATTIIALFIFKEAVSKRLWVAIFFITLSSVVLTCNDLSELKFSWGSCFVLLAAILWGFENNCTRKISEKNIYEIVTIKGIFSGIGSLIIGFAIDEHLPVIKYIVIVLILGYISYGLSIFFYIKAQKELGASKTSAYYAIAPFVGAFLSFIILKENFSVKFLSSFLLMIIGTVIATVDTMVLNHKHIHTHVITHTHDGSTHTHKITHEHMHSHLRNSDKHLHKHLLQGKYL